MGYQWSTIRINKLAGSLYAINDDIIIYVAPNGNDIDGDGSAGNPYATPHRAFVYLDDKTIGQNGSVVIKCAAGEYNNFTELYPKHQNGDKIYIEGAEPEVYIIKGCRTFDYEGVTAESNIHQMGLIVATADAGHAGDHAGWTSEHGLTQGDVNASYMLIFNTSIASDGYNPSNYPFATDTFFGSLLDNNQQTQQFNWGNGNASRYGLQWTKLIGCNKIVGVTGAKAREAGGVENAASDGVDKNCGITIEKYQASSRWSANEAWAGRTGPDRDQRFAYNDWQEVASLTVNPAFNGRRFVQNENIAVVAEFGGATNAGHTTGFAAYSTPTTMEGRVLRTVFNCDSSGVVLEDGHKLGGIANIAFVADNNNAYLAASTFGIYVRNGSCLGASGSSWPTYPTRNIGILGFGYGVNASSNSSVHATQIAVSADRFTDGDSPFNHQGYYGYACTGNSYMQVGESVSFGNRVGFISTSGSHMACNYGVASSHISKGGWLGWDPGVSVDIMDTFRSNYYIYQKQGVNGEFWARIRTAHEGTNRVTYEGIQGEPDTTHDANGTGKNFYIDADLDVAKDRGDVHAIVAATEALPSVHTTSGRGFSVTNGYLTCVNSVATAVADGYVASTSGTLVASKSVAHECHTYGFRGWLSNYVGCIDSCASRCYVGFQVSGGIMYAPYTWAINNYRWNYYSVTGHMAASKAISFEGGDCSLESHTRWDGPGTHSFNNFNGNSVYNVRDDLNEAKYRGLPDQGVNPPMHPIEFVAANCINERNATTPGSPTNRDNIPRHYSIGGIPPTTPVYRGSGYNDVGSVELAYDTRVGHNNPPYEGADNVKNYFTQNRQAHGATGVPGQIDRLL